MLKHGDKAYYTDSQGKKKIVTVSGNSGYNVTARDDYGRIFEFPAGKLEPVESERKNDEG